MRFKHTLKAVHCELCGETTNFHWDDDAEKTGFYCLCGHFEPSENITEEAIDWQLKREVLDSSVRFKPRN